MSLFTRFVAALACAHEWSVWTRESRELKGPYGITGPHFYNVRHCTKCGWHQEGAVTEVKS